MEIISIVFSIFLVAISALVSVKLFNALNFSIALSKLIGNRHRTIDWAVELLEKSPTPTVTIGPVVFTADPSNVEYVSKSRFGTHPRTDFIYSTFFDFVGDGILNTYGEPWRLQRKAASYEFCTGALRSFLLDRIWDSVHLNLLPFLQSAADEGRAFDLQRAFEHFSFDNISSMVLGHDPDSLNGRDDKGLYRLFEVVLDSTVERFKLPFKSLWKLKKLLNVGWERQLREALAAINSILAERYAEARSSDRRDSFLSKLVNSSNNYPDQFLNDLLLSLMLAGRDTVPSALTWFFLQAAQRPDVVEKIREEVRSVRTRSGSESPLTLDSLRQMNYLHAAYTESMRLYPPVVFVARDCLEEETLPDGTAVKKGWTVMYSQIAMGRSKELWGEDCKEFRPERWLVDDGAFRTRTPYEYTVFHAGPGVCLGKDLAMLQLKAVAASVLERFDVEMTEPRGEHDALITLTVRGGLPVRVTEIKK